MTTSVTFCTEAARSMSRWVRAVRIARRSTEQIVEFRTRHGQSRRVIEIAWIQPERAVILHVDELLQDQLGVTRLTIGRKPHHLVFAGVDLEADVIGEGGIEQAERMRPMDLTLQFERVALAD